MAIRKHRPGTGFRSRRRDREEQESLQAARLVRTSAGWKIRACKLTLSWQTGNSQIFTLASARFKASEGSKKE
jgi:hypothetical protein